MELCAPQYPRREGSLARSAWAPSRSAAARIVHKEWGPGQASLDELPIRRHIRAFPQTVIDTIAAPGTARRLRLSGEGWHFGSKNVAAVEAGYSEYVQAIA